MDETLSAEGPAMPGGEAVWRSLVTEPTTGVSIIDRRGRVVYINREATRIFLGPDTSPEDIVGRDMRDLLPAAFYEERIGYVRGVLERDEPLLIRSMWRGAQHYSWMHPVHDEEGTVRDRVLVISRHSGRHVEERVAEVEHIQFVEAEVIDLGPLKVLTPRERVVLALLGQGLSLKETADHLFRSVKTIQHQRDSIGRKLHMRDRGELIRLVQRVGLTVRDAERDSL